jgi:hypothetical protein
MKQSWKQKCTSAHPTATDTYVHITGQTEALQHKGTCCVDCNILIWDTPLCCVYNGLRKTVNRTNFFGFVKTN